MFYKYKYKTCFTVKGQCFEKVYKLKLGWQVQQKRQSCKNAGILCPVPR